MVTRLDYQPLFGRGARAPPPKARKERHERDERAVDIEPKWLPERRALFNHVLNRQKNKSAEPIATVPKNDIFFVLPFCEILARRVKSCVSKFYGDVTDVSVKRPSHGKLKFANSCWQT